MLSVERWWMFILCTNGRYTTSFLSFIVPWIYKTNPRKLARENMQRPRSTKTEKYHWRTSGRQMRLPSSVKCKCGYCIPNILPSDKHYRTSIHNYSTFIRGMTQPPYSLSPFIHQIVSEVIRPVARIFWRGVTSISNVYVYEQAGNTRGVWEDAPPGNF